MFSGKVHEPSILKYKGSGGGGRGGEVPPKGQKLPRMMASKCTNISVFSFGSHGNSELEIKHWPRAILYFRCCIPFLFLSLQFHKNIIMVSQLNPT